MRVSIQMKLADFVCVALVGSVALVAFAGAQVGARETAMRVRCASNLRQLSQAIAMYSNNEVRNGNAFPRVHYDYDKADDVKFFTEWKQPHSFGEGARRRTTSPRRFTCC